MADDGATFVIEAWKAQRTLQDKPIDSVVIRFATEVPNFETLDEGASGYREMAEQIMEALKPSLPGGLLDALLVEFLNAKRSLYKISPFDKDR